MAGKTFKVEVVTPERTLLSAEAESLIAPAYEGYLGILSGHSPMLCTLIPGEIKVRTAKGEEHLAVSGGFLEVGSGGVIVLADAAEIVSEIDVARAQGALTRAKDRLRSTAKEIDRDRAEAAQARATNRLALARRYGAKGATAGH